MFILTIVSTKGGVGKTTLAANLGAILAELGQRVLLVDADVQPSLSKYFPLYEQDSALGLTEVIVRGQVTAATVARTDVHNLHLVASDDPEGRLPAWLLSRIDRGYRLRVALRCEFVGDSFDFVLIDTQGALGPLQDAAVMAADCLLSPVTPEMLSAREFHDGTLQLLERLGPGSVLGEGAAPLKVLIYRQDRTLDARLIADSLALEFADDAGRISLLGTVVPHAKAYKEAATLRMPVHRLERRRRGVMPSAWDVMHRLVWELFPELAGREAGPLPTRGGSR